MRYATLAALLISLLQSAHSQSYTIETFAGGGFPADGPAVEPNLGSCHVGGLAVDPSGQLAISLTGCNVVMLLDRTGNLNRIAGTGISGFAGDGGPALSARLSVPLGVAFDTGGNLYIADSRNNRVRRVDAATGVISTVAGNGQADYQGGTIKAADAGIPDPRYVTIDHQGQLYISSTSANAIWHVDTKEGNISWTAGGMSRRGFGGDGGAAWGASIAVPLGLGVDGSGNLYFIDSGNYRIRKIDIQSGLITTVVGGGLHGFAVDGSAATDEQLGYLIDDLGVDAAGNLYFPNALMTSATIRRVDASSGKIYTLAAIAGAFAAKVNASGDKVYWTESNLVQLTAAGSTTVVAGGGVNTGDGGDPTKAMLNRPTTTAVDASGAVYIWDTGNNKVRKVSHGVISTYAGNGRFFTAGSDGDGAPATAAPLHGQEHGGLAFDGDGNLLLAEEGYIRKVDASSGVITTIAGKPTDPRCRQYGGESGVSALGVCLDGIAGLALDAAGNMFFPLIRDDLVVKVPKQTGLLEWYAGNRHRGFSGDGNAATSAMLAIPYGIAVDAHGNVFIADSMNACIRRVDAATGIISVVAGIGEFGPAPGDGALATRKRLDRPTSVAVDTRGNMFIADTGAQEIYRVDATTGIIATIAGGNGIGFSGDGGPATGAMLSNPTGLSVDASGRIYFSSDDNRVRVLIPSGGSGGTTACSSVSLSPIQSTISAAGGTLSLSVVPVDQACTWSVSNLPSWITAVPSAGVGSAAVSLTVAANPGTSRVATGEVNGAGFLVNQDASPSRCTYDIHPPVQDFPAGGGVGTIAVTAEAGCAWIAAPPPAWITWTSASTGTGSGSVSYAVAASTGPPRTASLQVANLTVAVNQNGGTESAAGVMGHFAAGAGWETTFTLVNAGSFPAHAQLEFFDDDGRALAPQSFLGPTTASPELAGTASTVGGVLNPGALVQVSAPAGTTTSQTGWARLLTDGFANGFGVFRLPVDNGFQEAVVPAESRTSSSFILPFDNTGGYFYGVAVANLSTNDQVIDVIFRDALTGNTLDTGQLSLVAGGHTQFLLGDRFPKAVGMTGTAEFLAAGASAGPISLLGLRFNSNHAFTSVPVFVHGTTAIDVPLANAGALTHLAVGGGWTTTFSLVNTGKTFAYANLKFLDDAGLALPVPMSWRPGSDLPADAYGGIGVALDPGAMVLVECADAKAQIGQSGWAQLSTNGSVQAFAVFRYTTNAVSQEAVVPFSPSGVGPSLLAFDHTDGYTSAVAVANNSADAATISLTIRDAVTGGSTGAGTLDLPPWGHTSFLLTDRYPVTQGVRGTVEIRSNSGQVSVLGLRVNSNAAFTSIPAIEKR